MRHQAPRARQNPNRPNLFNFNFAFWAEIQKLKLWSFRPLKNGLFRPCFSRLKRSEKENFQIGRYFAILEVMFSEPEGEKSRAGLKRKPAACLNSPLPV